jgi:hypothetical protein
MSTKRKDLDDLKYGLERRMAICIELVDKVFASIKAHERIANIDLYEDTGFRELAYQTHQVDDAVHELLKAMGGCK